MSTPDWLYWADEEKKRRRENPELTKCPLCRELVPPCTPGHHTLACPTRWYVCEPDESAGVRDAAQ